MIGSWRRRHDPERDAAEYLAGEQSRGARERFEAHLISCQHCWREVEMGRAGRAVAERGREMAPPHLREDVRAAVSLSTEPPRRRLLVPSALSVLVAGAVVGAVLVVTLGARHPEPIAAALLSFRSNRIDVVAPPDRPPPDLSEVVVGLARKSSGRAVVAGLPVDVFTYSSPQGKRMFLYFSQRPFPEARDARERSGSAEGWEAVDGDVFLLCGEEPAPYLLIGTDRKLLQRTERALRKQNV